MRLVLPVLFSLFICLLSHGQSNSTIIEQYQDSIIQLFYQYNVVYPEEAVENNIQGTIILMFDVDSTCSFVNRSQNIKLGFGCDEISWSTLDKFENDFKKQNNNKCPNKSSWSIPVVFSLSYD